MYGHCNPNVAPTGHNTPACLPRVDMASPGPNAFAGGTRAVANGTSTFATEGRVGDNNTTPSLLSLTCPLTHPSYDSQAVTMSATTDLPDGITAMDATILKTACPPSRSCWNLTSTACQERRHLEVQRSGEHAPDDSCCPGMGERMPGIPASRARESALLHYSAGSTDDRHRDYNRQLRLCSVTES